MQKDIIQLGKKLIEELELGHDITSQWMAMYISEQIAKAEHASGEEKDTVEKQCFEAILGLWEKRYAMKNGSRPFENFENVIETISALNSTTTEFFYLRRVLDHGESLEKSHNTDNWIECAKDTDKAARAMINYCLEQAILNAKDKKTISWLNTNFKLPDSDIPEVMINFFAANTDGEPEDKSEVLVAPIKRKLTTYGKLQRLLDKIVTDLTENLDALNTQKNLHADKDE